MTSPFRAGTLIAGVAGLCMAPADVLYAQTRGQVLPGSKSNQPVDIDATKLDYFDKQQKLVYKGGVVASQGDSRLKASMLVIYLLPKEDGDAAGPAGNAQVRRMEASGPVTMTSKDQVGTGDSGIYEKADNKVTLIGNVTLTQGPNVTTGDRLVYDLATSQAVVQGHVHSMFIPNTTTSASAASPPASGPASAKPAKTLAKDRPRPKDVR